ncbi:MAG: hypothetical protein QOG61_1766, partial [Candidatus Binataceae bacterium]|nr:hypothetical protein [Candidatus Binataceae bacterium]
RILIELAMLGQHDAVERALGALEFQPVKIRLQRGAAIFGSLAMAVQVKDCAHSAGTSPRRAKIHERHLRGDVVEDGLDGHPYLNLFRGAVDNVGEHLEAFIDLDPRHHIGQ